MSKFAAMKHDAKLMHRSSIANRRQGNLNLLKLQNVVSFLMDAQGVRLAAGGDGSSLLSERVSERLMISLSECTFFRRFLSAFSLQ
jgi:hypothetical protein